MYRFCTVQFLDLKRECRHRPAGGGARAARDTDYVNGLCAFFCCCYDSVHCPSQILSITSSGAAGVLAFLQPLLDTLIRSSKDELGI